MLDRRIETSIGPNNSQNNDTELHKMGVTLLLDTEEWCSTYTHRLKTNCTHNEVLVVSNIRGSCSGD
jgi:hypothetical protein